MFYGIQLTQGCQTHQYPRQVVQNWQNTKYCMHSSFTTGQYISEKPRSLLYVCYMISGCPCFPGTVTTTNVSGTRYGNKVSLVLADVKSHKVEIWNKWQGQPRFYNSSTKTASSHLQILKVLVCCWCQFVWHNTRNFWNRNQWNMQNKCRNCGVMWYSESLKECFCFPGKNAFGGIRRWYPYPFQLL